MKFANLSWNACKSRFFDLSLALHSGMPTNTGSMPSPSSMRTHSPFASAPSSPTVSCLGSRLLSTCPNGNRPKSTAVWIKNLKAKQALQQALHTLETMPGACMPPSQQASKHCNLHGQAAARADTLCNQNDASTVPAPIFLC